MKRVLSRRLGTPSRGFTIVELLIVVVVIAILAAITVVAYNGISQRAGESAAMTSASQALKKIKAYQITNGEVLPADLATAGLPSTGGVQYQYTTNTATTPQGFCVTATQNGRSARIASNFTYNGSTVLNEEKGTIGACPGHSSTGGAAIQNLATNPSFETNTTGWGTSSSSITTQTTWASSGTRALRVINAGTSDSGDTRIGGPLTSMPLGLQPGKTYTISARLYFTAAPTGGYTRAPGVLVWYSTNGTSWTTDFGPKAPTTPGTYTVSHTVTFPANTTGAIIGFGVASSTISQQFFYDSVMVTEGSTPYTYADGASAGWIWLGTPQESASTGPVL